MRSFGGYVLLGALRHWVSLPTSRGLRMVATSPSLCFGSHRERQVADLAYRIVLDRDVLHVDPRVPHIGEEPRQRTGLVRDGDDDLAVVPGRGSVLAGDLPRPGDRPLQLVVQLFGRRARPRRP